MPVHYSRCMVGCLLPALSMMLLTSSPTAAQSYITRDSASDRLSKQHVQPGTDKDGAQLLKRLNGVILENKAGSARLSSLNVYGLGARYNQVLFNDAPLTSLNPIKRSYPFDFIPIEAIEEVSVQRAGNPAIPADVAGGTVSIRLKDMPDENFFYIRAGAGLSDATNGKDFYSDKRGSLEWLSFPGSIRDLPGSFPTTQSQFSLDQLNTQEQVSLSRQLKNNLAPINHGAAAPDEKILLGFGKNIPLKEGTKIGIIALLNQQGATRIDESTVQLTHAHSNDVNYRQSSQLGAVLNASVLFGKNKIAWKNLFSHQFNNTYTRRSQLLKPDEDSLAHTGINYLTEQTTFLNTQLSGEHFFGGDGKFKMTWQATYTYHHEEDPDERNFLLRQDSTGGNTYELAVPQTLFFIDYQMPSSKNTIEPGFTNSGRWWRNVTEHDFTGMVNLQTPFNIGEQPQILSGGVGIQSKYRILHSDLLLAHGPGYYTLDQLLAPDRYYPGGLEVVNFFANGKSVFAVSNSAYIDPTNRGNYVASDNLGSAYLRLEDHLLKSLYIDWGLRLESNSQLVSNSQYAYSAGFKNPQLLTIDENTRISSTELLPSVELVYHPIQPLRLHAMGARTVNRPELQELSAYRHYDALSFMVTQGNQFLANTRIDNYDAGVDWITKGGTHLSLSGFYKRMDQPIENVLSPYSSSIGNVLVTPYNTAPADLHGLTASFRSSLAAKGWLSNIAVFANGTWLSSTVDGGPVRNTSTAALKEHTLSGTPDYTMNTGLTIQHPRYSMLTVLYHRIGDYISVVGSAGMPDYRIKDRDQLDLQLSQKLLKCRIQIIAGVNNLTSSAYTEYQDLDGNKKFDRDVDNTVMNIKPQRTYFLTISYLFR